MPGAESSCVLAVNMGFEAVNLPLKHPNKKQFRRFVSEVVQGHLRAVDG